MEQNKDKYLLGPVAVNFSSVDTGKWRVKRPEFNDNCKKCQQCLMYCPCNVISLNESMSKPEVDLSYCKGCGICTTVCKFDAINMVEEK